MVVSIRIWTDFKLVCSQFATIKSNRFLLAPMKQQFSKLNNRDLMSS